MEPNENKSKRLRLSFSTRSYPTFGRGAYSEVRPPQTVLDSPYYWWFKYLQLNPEYAKTCKADGKGKYSELYKDFGNVHKMNFKEWWIVRDHLFAEPTTGYRMSIASNMSEIAPFNDDAVLNLVVPMTWSQRSLKKAFTQLVLNKIEKGKKGISVEKSEAKYKISGRWHIEALSMAYRIYTIKKLSDQMGEKKYWADIAVEAKMPMSFQLQKNNSVVNKDVRRTLTILAVRHYNRAEEFIKSAASNSFPYNNN